MFFKSTKLLSFLFLFIFSNILFAQVGIGTTTVDESAILQIDSNTQGILIPRMTETQRNSITSPVNGLLVFQTDAQEGYWFYNGSAWQQFTSSGWSTTGDSGTSNSEFVGTADSQDFSLKANNTEGIRIDTNQNIGIGITTPQEQLHISGTAPVLRITDGNEANGRVLISDINGNTNWQDIPATGSNGADEDWIFEDLPDNTATTSDVYRRGNTVIGRTGTTTYNLHIDNGSNTGTTFGFGDVEHIEDGNNETYINASVFPQNPFFGAPNPNIGTADLRWSTIYAVNGTVQTSDKRLKENITPLEYGLNELLQLKPVSYYWKEENVNNIKIPNKDKQLQLGLIAQEINEVIPEVVYKEGYVLEKENAPYVKKEYARMGINYEELLPLLVNAKKEQKIKIDALVKENEEMIKTLETLLKKTKK